MIERRRAQLATFAALFVLLSLTGTSIVSAGSLRVDPSRISADQPLSPGQTIALPVISVTNDMGFDAIITISVSDCEDEERVLPPKDWFAIRPVQLELLDGATGEVEVAVTLPNDAPPDSYKVWFQYNSQAVSPGTGVTHVLSMLGPFIFDVKAEDHTITLSIEGQGTLTPSPDTYTHHQGTVLELKAEPAQGWKFSHWIGLPLESGAQTTHMVVADADITAVFERSEYQLTIAEPEGQGTVTPDAGRYTHTYEDVVQVSAEPADLWKFVRWEGPVKDEASSDTTVTVLGDAEVRPILAPLQLQSLRVEPSWLQLAPEDSREVRVFAVYEDGTEVEVTEKATWVSADETVAVPSEQGTLTAHTLGETTLRTEYEGMTAQVEVEVVEAQDIEVSESATAVDPWVLLAGAMAAGGLIIYRRRKNSG